MADNLKPRSGVITDGPDRAPTRAMLKAVGFTDEDLRRPIIGVANTWIEIGPVQLSLAPAGGEGERGHPRRRRHADGVQHRVDFRRHQHGRRRHEVLADQPRGDRRFH